MPRMKPLMLDTSGMTVQEMEKWGTELADVQLGLNWYLGDLARAARVKLGDDNYSQVFPPSISAGAVQRWEAVARAYPREEDRNPLASWSIHMREANRPDRIARIQSHVDAGRTSDEARKPEQPTSSAPPAPWLVAFDVHYFAHRHYYSGAGVETAMQVAEWVQRTVARLKAKGCTDVVCAFEGAGNFRKELTMEWEGEHYKDRPPKPEDLKHQLQLVRGILQGFGFLCVSLNGYEADDVLASYAAQFKGKTTIVSSDKDLRQCLSEKCNMLLDVEWTTDETSGDTLPEYKWLSAKQHTEATGIPPERWVEFQTLMGDATDGIKGAIGIGEKGAADLVKMFGTVEAAIQAAKDGDERIREVKRKSLIDFEAKLEVTRKLVTLRTDLEVASQTRI